MLSVRIQLSVALILLFATTSCVFSQRNNGFRLTHHKPDSVGPIGIQFEKVDTSIFTDNKSHVPVKFPYGYVLNARTNEFSKWSELTDAFCYLLYKGNPDDSLYTCITLPFTTLIVDTADLDHKGKRELIVNGKYCYNGMNGGSCEGAVIVMNIDNEPVLLLNVYNSYLTETFVTAERPVNFEYERPVYREGDKIIIMPNDLKELKNIRAEFRGFNFSLTKIPSGIYSFQDNHVRRKRLLN